MKVGDSIRHAIRQVVESNSEAKFQMKLAWLRARTKVFNAQRAHRHPATLSPVRRAKLRRS